ncbi:Uncharacterized protein HZ326_10474 [Fusarium oxysporum f. sp. albedinis]|nr:Uncharacterized protein HZ326_10474 [Fusarium oxysporum f. sp. albedinis]
MAFSFTFQALNSWLICCSSFTYFALQAWTVHWLCSEYVYTCSMVKALFNISCMGNFLRLIGYSIVIAPSTARDSVHSIKCIPFGNMRQ